MSPADSTGPEDGSRRRVLSIWVAPLVVLFAVWLWLAFSSGGFIPRHWLVPSVMLGFIGLVVSLLTIYPRRPRQLSLAVLAIFSCFGIWVMFSGLWAASTNGVWLESGRTLTYLTVFALAAVYLTDRSARKTFPYLFMAAAFFLLVAVVWRLWSSNDVTSMFFVDRLSYPVTYPNNAAALFLIGFWPLMWLAAGSKKSAPVRGLALGLATGLLGLAIMTQSRGAIWTLAITLVLMFAVSPARLRTLFFLVVPALLMVYEFPILNRYWEEGAQSVGGAAGARTLVVASVVAAFVGMILALLERWVNVSRRMKAIFGSVVFVGVAALVVYGSIVLTADTGGPFKWLSQTWRQFTQTSAEGSADAETSSRFTVIDSNGRVGIWRVAWKEFKAEPVLGVGANNFVFEYDRLRVSETSKPQHPHSLFLQVLAETGIPGGILFAGSVFLVLGGLLWPRCTAGWRRARETWLKPSRPLNPRVCNPRWGADPLAYGWEMALLVALSYWLIHGSVEWLWQMIGVSIPAFLILAAALAEVDARAEVMWPRWSDRLRASAADSEGRSETLETTEELDPYTDHIGGRAQKKTKRGESVTRLQPPGVLSLSFRLWLLVLSLLLVLGAGLPYLALRYEESALALARTNGVEAVARAASAHWLQPADPKPFLTQATIYENAAAKMLTADDADQSGGVLDNLALAVDACDRAMALEPADWSLRYRAGVSVINLLMATEYSSGGTVDLDIPSLIPLVPGLIDLSVLAGVGGEPLQAGESEGSLARNATTRAIAGRYRDMSPEQLGKIANAYLTSAGQRNPLASQIGEAKALVERVVNP